MSTVGAFDAALFGIRRHLDLFQQHAQQLTRPVTEIDLPAELVGMKIAKAGIQANVASARAADEVLSDLLDVLA